MGCLLGILFGIGIGNLIETENKLLVISISGCIGATIGIFLGSLVAYNIFKASPSVHISTEMERTNVHVEAVTAEILE